MKKQEANAVRLAARDCNRRDSFCIQTISKDLPPPKATLEVPNPELTLVIQQYDVRGPAIGGKNNGTISRT